MTVGAHNLLYSGNDHRRRNSPSRMQDGEPIGQAWLESTWYADNSNAPSAMATGANANDCWNRMGVSLSYPIRNIGSAGLSNRIVCWSLGTEGEQPCGYQSASIGMILTAVLSMAASRNGIRREFAAIRTIRGRHGHRIGREVSPGARASNVRTSDATIASLMTSLTKVDSSLSVEKTVVGQSERGRVLVTGRD